MQKVGFNYVGYLLLDFLDLTHLFELAVFEPRR